MLNKKKKKIAALKLPSRCLVQTPESQPQREEEQEGTDSDLGLQSIQAHLIYLTGVT